MASPTLDGSALPAQQSATRTAPGMRDPRLDFFRGIAMFIILIAHIPRDWLALWIPARFGFSDATETFVFCSGMASAIAFGRVFSERGWLMGAMRVAYRVWQVYWAHICLFMAVAVSMVALSALIPDGRNYVGQLNLYPFFNNPLSQLPGLLTLTYVPNYFDILPMYLVILAMLPLVVALARWHVAAAAIAVIGVWLLANVADVNLPAEPWSERGWFFNPFGWQLVFFTGFALMAGWLPAPPVDRRLFWACVAILVIALPFAYFRIYTAFPVFLEWRREWAFLINKTDFGILRYVHFLASAYVAWVLVGERGARLIPSGSGEILSRLWAAILKIVMKVGQQSLAVFVASMFIAQWLGALLDVLGRNWATMVLVNGLGFAIIIAVAFAVARIKAQPWKSRRSEKDAVRASA